MTVLRPDIELRLVEQLKLQFPDLFTNDEEGWSLTLASETNTDEVLSAFVEQEQEASALADAADARVSKLKERAKMFRARGDRIRAAALYYMVKAGIKTWVLPLATLSVRKGSVKPVFEDSNVPEEFCNFKTTATPDRQRIKEHLEAGNAVNWATLEEGKPSLTVRTV